MQKYNSRQDVPEEFKWDLNEFYKNDEEYNLAYDKTKKLITELSEYVGCTKNPSKLYEFLIKEIEAESYWEELYVYCVLTCDQELGNSKSMQRRNKGEILCSELNNNINFFAPELLKLTKEEYDDLFVKEPKLLEFKHSLDVIYRDKDHILSEAEEKIISELVISTNHYEDISSNLLNSEHDYGKIKIDNEEITIATNNFRYLTKNKDQKIRKKVYEQFHKTLNQYGNTSASLLNSYVSMNNTTAKLHKYKDSWEEKLASINLSNKVFETLVSVTENNLDVLQKFYKLKKEVLNLKTLNKYDLNLEMSTSPKEYSIKAAQELVRNSVSVLGEEYLSKYDKAIKNKHIDYCQYKGKTSGGYNISCNTKDSRILMNYNGDLASVSTIAHEIGHDINHQFINENNPLQYRCPSQLVAEVASLTNEFLLSHYITYNSSNKEEKLAGLENIIDVIVSNLYGSVREGKLEQDMYTEVANGGMITQEFMDKITLDSCKKYYGNAVKVDNNIKNTWITRSHYYLHFYLYNYAFCTCIATNVAQKIINGDQEMLSTYIKFLKTGSSIWPYDAFKILGIDLEDECVYENAIKYLDSLIEQYKEIYNSKEA